LAPDLPVAVVERLLGRYGSAITDLLAMISRSPELAVPLRAAPRYLAAEVVYAVTHEGALDLDDLLSRRTRIAIEYPDRGLAAAEKVTRLIGEHLGWHDSGREEAVRAYAELARAERDALDAPDDTTALARSDG
jgi:glycerol-3-phosphate dehydrogenase